MSGLVKHACAHGGQKRYSYFVKVRLGEMYVDQGNMDINDRATVWGLVKQAN